MPEVTHTGGRRPSLESDPLIRRAAAWVLDAMLAGGALFGGLVFLAIGSLTRALEPRIIGAAFLALAAAYVLTKDARLNGFGVGKRRFRLLVVDAATGVPCSRRQAAVRGLVGAALWVVPVVEPIAILASPERRGLADRVAGTLVIEEAGAPARPPAGRRWWVRLGLVAGVALSLGLAFPHLTRGLPEARIQTARSDLVKIGYAVEQFVAQTGRLPASIQELLDQRYLRVKGPCVMDPWGNCYLYEPSFPGTGLARFTLRSLGADGAPGGEGEDADLVEVGGRP